MSNISDTEIEAKSKQFFIDYPLASAREYKAFLLSIGWDETKEPR